MIPNVPASEATDLSTLGVLAVAVIGFLYGLVNVKRASPSDLIETIRQRDEARADLEDCERRCRALERALSKLENGHER